jgi:hypothetical protein
MAIRFISKATVKNKLPRSSNIWDGTAVYNPFTLVGNYDALATVTLSAGVSSITFAGIPQTGYSHLQIRGIVKTAYANAQDGLKIQVNGNTGSSYNYHYVGGNGSSVYAGAGGSSAQTFMQSESIAGATNASVFGVIVLDILDYASNVKNKVLRAIGGVDNNGSGVVEMWSGLYISTNPINSINIFSFNGANLSQYSQLALYGVKA